MSEEKKSGKHEEDNFKDKKETKSEQKYVKSVWKSVSIASVALCVILAIVLATGIGSGSNIVGGDDFEGALSPEDASDRALSFVQENMVGPGVEISVKEVKEELGLYKVVIEVKSGSQTQNVDSYVTKNAEIFFPQAVNITEVEMALEEQQQEEQQQQEDIPKTDEPKAQAFVMSYCPYGLQFMKAYIPVIELLGDKADVMLNFVDYAMHGKEELDENLRMYCIQKEQKDKFSDYLRCFVETDDYESCISESGVDKSKLETCIQSTDNEYNITGLYNDENTWSGGRFPQFPVESDLNEEYGVRGSPTFVVNGKTVSVGRSAEAIKNTICSAFTNPPEECDQTLSDLTEDPGIGPIGSGSGSASSTGGC